MKYLLLLFLAFSARGAVIIHPATIPINAAASSASPGLWGSISTNQTLGSYQIALTGIPANAFLVATVADENSSGSQSVTSASGTWAATATAVAANSGNCSIWTNRFAAGGDMTLTITRSVGSSHSSATFQAYTNVTATPVGAIVTNTAKNPGTASITISQTASTAVLVGSDFAAISGTVAYTNTPVTEILVGTDFQSTAYRGIHIIKTNLSTGAIIMGQATPTGTKYGICVMELKGP